MGLFIIRVGSGHDWLVEAESEDSALAEWPDDAEDAICADASSPEEALACQDAGESDVCDDDLATWLMAHAQWVFRHAPSPADDTAMGLDLIAFGDLVLASGLWANGDLDVESDGCGITSSVNAYLSVDDVDWPSEDEARRAVWGEHPEHAGLDTQS